MKKFYCIACLLTTLLLAVLASSSFAQDGYPKVKNANVDEDGYPLSEKGFKKENLFTGGGLTASFFSGGTVLGASPVLGYKLNDYFDAGVALNYVYTGYRDYMEFGDKVRQHVFGPGVFVRAYPVKFLFAQAQLEQNFTAFRYTPAPNGGLTPYKNTVNAPSLLLGGGLATGRQKGSTTFYYISVLVDVLKNRNSPYVSVKNAGTTSERIDLIPIIRAGINVGLFQGRYNNSYERF